MHCPFSSVLRYVEEPKRRVKPVRSRHLSYQGHRMVKHEPCVNRNSVIEIIRERNEAPVRAIIRVERCSCRACVSPPWFETFRSIRHPYETSMFPFVCYEP